MVVRRNLFIDKTPETQQRTRKWKNTQTRNHKPLGFRIQPNSPSRRRGEREAEKPRSPDGNFACTPPHRVNGRRPSTEPREFKRPLVSLNFPGEHDPRCPLGVVLGKSRAMPQQHVRHDGVAFFQELGIQLIGESCGE